MKFNYLKLTLLAASFAMAPAFMKAETDIDLAVQDVMQYLDPNGPQRNADETIAVMDKALGVLQGKPEYQDVYIALQEIKNMFVKLNIAQAQGVLERVTGQLQTIHTSLSDSTRNMVNARLEQLKNLNKLQQLGFMRRLGITIFGRK
jgi:hypothetical protein